MREIWANYLLPKALKSCPKSKKIAKSGHTACKPLHCIVVLYILESCKLLQSELVVHMKWVLCICWIRTI